MGKTGSNLLFLAVGAAIGAAVGYVAAYDKRDELLRDLVDYAYKIKDNVKAVAEKGKEELDEIVEELDAKKK